ncbi:hypothetical protein C1I97_05595 [Streptomyces sp. NTH33]|nr:hypothetical protein C1I97_05595 [Streptomyces sp. NTH33]
MGSGQAVAAQQGGGGEIGVLGRTRSSLACSAPGAYRLTAHTPREPGLGEALVAVRPAGPPAPVSPGPTPPR